MNEEVTKEEGRYHVTVSQPDKTSECDHKKMLLKQINHFPARMYVLCKVISCPIYWR